MSSLREAESRTPKVPALSEVKTLQDPRHLKRKRVVEELFSSGFVPHRTATTNPVVRSIHRHRKKIDGLVAKSAPAGPLPKVNRVDLAILRLATWELVIEKKPPQKVIIDGAVELAKLYGADGSPGFVNGVLGSLLKSL